LTLPPAILLGANVVTAISVIRSLGRKGVPVHLLCYEGATPSYSKHARRIPLDPALPQQEAWRRYLLGPETEGLRGAVLLACNDDGIELLLDHRDELGERYLLDLSEPAAQRAMLDKLATYRAAQEAGVATPRFWPAAGEDEVRAHASEYEYPLMVKPLYAHRFKQAMDGKYLIVHDLEELLAAVRRVHEQGVEVLLLEVIPGPDDLLRSYFTYLDERGEPLFHFTKRVIRRYPEHEGFGCYHITDWDPDVRDAALRLVRHVGLKGVANVEFKRDPRDGRLKLMECNARFVASNGLVVASGYDLGLLVYSRLVGLPPPPLPDSYPSGLRLWSPFNDARAFLALRRQGRLSLAGWLRDVAHPQLLPYADCDDPLPSLVRLRGDLRTLAVSGARRVAPGLLSSARSSEGQPSGREEGAS
jgi:predicted ATP-grasp superfamily ATP-dependent carboligase